jgi:LmbE family N-acetylglucosaminyl deacetylase
MLLLPQVADVSRSAINASDVAIVVAHPDDETIGCGALLSRLENVSVVVVTDGAPRNGADACRAGFASALAYGKARTQELRTALALAGIGGSQIAQFGIADQDVCRSLVATSNRLASFFETRGITTALTHAFEGGHPDHDGTCFCVHAAARLLERHAPVLLEMPFYHLGAEALVAQTFCDGEDEVVTILLPRERLVKIKMMDAHASQSQVLSAFNPDIERFRTARKYDFCKLPNGGRILYSFYDWGLRPQEWSQLAHEALQAMQLGDGA